MIGALCFLVKLTADKLSANTCPLARIALLFLSNDSFAISSAVSYLSFPETLFPVKPFSGSWFLPPIAISCRFDYGYVNPSLKTITDL